ncbi:MAG: exodeoxyribonuclease VII large subunit [Bacteroidaceae bacterium]|nr:exodeoxyribonuclease VII large subunit [Bacteroidaceae bacterium]
MTLYELNRLVRQSIEDGLPDTYWVTGELLEGRQGGGGHFYGELVQKDEQSHAIIAKARLNIWANQYVRLRAHFEMETGQTLRAGLKIQVLVSVTFHEQYGYSLVGLDIDSSYTLGDLVRRRREILNRLEEEGVLHDNQTLPLPRLLNRIAVVSSEKAAGYGDFCDQLLHNNYNLRFHLRLFPATMQGQHTEDSVLQAMTAIMEDMNNWDAVVIIRGGGATSDLADFESYALASAVAQFPIPVIVGIGHDRDETVLDFVAHTRVKTPTAAAAFLVEHQKEELLTLNDMEVRIADAVTTQLQHEKQRLEHAGTLLPLVFSRLKEKIDHQLTLLGRRTETAILRQMEREQMRLKLSEQRIHLLDPQRILQLGYSITTCQGKVVRDASQLQSGDKLTTQLEKGTVTSIVNDVV